MLGLFADVLFCYVVGWLVEILAARMAGGLIAGWWLVH